jgi:hypothetical protein
MMLDETFEIFLFFNPALLVINFTEGQHGNIQENSIYHVLEDNEHIAILRGHSLISFLHP